jgi:hypothetical protein
MDELQTIKALLNGLAEYYRTTLSANQLRMYAEDLQDMGAEAVGLAIRAIRRNPAQKFMPLPAEIRQCLYKTVGDGRPSADEAWAMIPQDEDATVVWCDEMREAYGVCRALISEDRVAARMAFKAAYEKALVRSREMNAPVRWEVSLGHDKGARDVVVREAVAKGLITTQTAAALLPAPVAPELKALLLPGTTEDEPLESADIASRVGEVIRAMTKGEAS